MSEHQNQSSFILRGGLSGLALGAIMLGGLPLAAAEAQITVRPTLVDIERGETLAGAYLAARQARIERDTEAAARYSLRALALDPENQVMREQALTLLLSDGRIRDAVRLADETIETLPGHRFANLTRIVTDFRAGAYDKVISRIDQAEPGVFNVLIASMMKAWAYQGLGQYDAAMAALSPLKQRQSFMFFHDYHAGLLSAVNGNDDLAASFFADAMDSNLSLSTRAAVVFGTNLEATGKIEKARALYKARLETTPNDIVLKGAIARLDRGERAGREIASVIDGGAEALFNLGAVLAQERGIERAAIYLNLTRHLRPKFDMAQMALAEIREQSDNWARVIALYDGIESNSVFKSSALIRKAYALEEYERVDESIALLKELSAGDPENRQIYMSLGHIMRGQERFAEAANAYDSAIALIDEPQPEDWSLYYARGVSLERSGKWLRAEADLKQALELRPDHPLVLNYLGYSWIEKGQNLDKALEMVKKAVDIRPDDGYVIDSLGWAYYQIGDYKSAVRELVRAIELTPHDPVIQDHLGDVFWLVGRKLEARFQWNHSLVLGPPEKDKARIVRKLEVGLDKVLAEEAAEVPETSSVGDQGGNDG